MLQGQKIVVVMPAYNAARTLRQTYDEVMAHGIVDRVILVDDGSKDETAALARALPQVQVEVHPQNRGYGGNQKTCYRLALAAGADIVIMIHPDYQYDSRLTPYLIGFLKEGFLDVMLGSRIRTRKEALSGGMPLYKYLANRTLTFIENILLGMNLSEWHTGFRAYTRKVLETIPWHDNSDDFVFDSQVLVQCVSFGFRIGEIPIPVRYHDTSSSINFRRSMKYGILTIVTALRFVLHRLHIVRSRLFAEP